MSNDIPPGAHSVESFAKGYKLGRTQVYKEINDGRLRTFLIGKRRLISFEAATEWRRNREKETAERVP